MSLSNSLAPTPPSKDDPSRHTGRYPAPPGSHHSSYPTEPETFIPGLLPPMYPPRVHDSQSTGPAQTLRATLDHLPNPQNNDPLMPRHLPNVNRDFTIPDSISTHPDDKPSLSRRLFSHLITKPTLSRTWENRNYAEDTRSNDTSSRDLESAEQNANRRAASTTRPTSLYVSPAAIASFRALPQVVPHQTVTRV